MKGWGGSLPKVLLTCGLGTLVYSSFCMCANIRTPTKNNSLLHLPPHQASRRILRRVFVRLLVRLWHRQRRLDPRQGQEETSKRRRRWRQEAWRRGLSRPQPRPRPRQQQQQWGWWRCQEKEKEAHPESKRLRKDAQGQTQGACSRRGAWCVGAMTFSC